MKKTFLRFVSTALAVFMLFGSLNIGVFAADFADEQNKATDSSEEIKFSVAIESATLATLVANIRYLLMGCALSQRLDEKTPLRHRLLMAFHLTDELFGIAISRKTEITKTYS